MGIVGRVVEDLELVPAPVDARHSAIATARPAAERPGEQVEVTAARPPVVPQLKQKALEQGVAADLLLGQRVGREVFVLLVGFHAVAEALGVRGGRGAVAVRHGLVQVVAVDRTARKAIAALGIHAVERETRSHEHRPAEATGVVLELHRGEVHLEAKDLEIELLPLLPPIGRRGVDRSRSRSRVEDIEELRVVHHPLEVQGNLRSLASAVQDHLGHGRPQLEEKLKPVIDATTHGCSPFPMLTPATNRCPFLACQSAGSHKKKFLLPTWSQKLFLIIYLILTENNGL